MADISAVLIAAGESTRMGRPKPMLPWQNETLLEYQICSLLHGGVQEVIVVLGHQASQIIPVVRGPSVKSVINTHYRQGKATSLKVGISSISHSAKHILFLAVDQPRPVKIIGRLLEEHQKSGAPITAPRYQDHGGHPLIFSTALKPELERISEEKLGIREVMEAHKGEINWVPVDTPLVRLDINDPKTYEEAKRMFGNVP